MGYTMEKLDKSMVKIQIEVDADTFEKALNTAYLKERGRYSIQGFRKGHAPRKMIENYYGEHVFDEGAVDEVWPDALQKAVDELKLDIVGRPSILIEHAKQGEPLKLAITIAVYPEVELGEYKGIEIEKVENTVTDAQVDAELERERQSRARYVDVERPIQEGDQITFDYKGKVDGAYFEGGSAEGADLEIGSHRFIPGFEEAMVGIPAGEKAEIQVTFPEEYHAEELKGKDAVFEVYVHEIREKDLPDMDDEFAKDASEFDTLKEWHDDLKEKMQKTADNRAKTQMQNALIAKIAEGCKVEIPDVLIENQMDQLLRDFATRLSYQGLSLEMYCQYSGIKPEDLREQFRNEAGQRVLNQLVLDEITKKEGIQASEEEIDARIQEVADYQKKPFDEVKQGLKEEDLKYLGEDLAIEKTLDFLLDQAKLVAKKEEKKTQKKAPAKKPAAKKETAEKKAPAKKAAPKKKAEPKEEK